MHGETVKLTKNSFQVLKKEIFDNEPGQILYLARDGDKALHNATVCRVQRPLAQAHVTYPSCTPSFPFFAYTFLSSPFHFSSH